jgi:hypothetical protein
MGDQRRNVGRLDRLRILLELSKCRPSRIDGSGGQGDLDLGSQ